MFDFDPVQLTSATPKWRASFFLPLIARSRTSIMHRFIAGVGHV